MSLMIDRGKTTGPGALVRPDGAPVRVLGVDDEPNLAEVLSSVLRHEGWELRSAATGVSAVRTGREFQPDAIVLDTSQYPTATFTLTDPLDLGALATAAGTRTLDAAGTLSMHGATKNVAVALSVVRSGATLTVSAQMSVVFADYGIANPSFGFVETEDDGTIEILLNLTKA